MRLRAMAFGRYPNFFAAARTFLRVSGEALAFGVKTRDTAAWDTPANRATSIEETRLLSFLALRLFFVWVAIDIHLFHNLESRTSLNTYAIIRQKSICVKMEIAQIGAKTLHN